MTSLHHDTSVINPGTVYLIYGQADKLTSQTVANRPRWTGEAKNDHAGASLVGAGDINNDGLADFAVGATWHNDRSGRVYLIYGQADAFTSEHDLNDHPYFLG